ncbi:MAG TPA: NAD(P)H-dependent oxidoreductase [Patescibacteria group bacterium]|nr:NAD(P)H-dependent oxidoreductase [Patescibacteria group bacterium]
MRISVIVGHPRSRSFNCALARLCVRLLRRNGHTVYFHDLYREKFDPLLPAAEIPQRAPIRRTIKKYCAELADSDGLIIVHPNWWGQPPAVVKGWVDRVMRPGVAYAFAAGDSGAGVPRGLLKIRKALVLNTSDTPASREKKVFGDPLEIIWKNCIFGFCGAKSFRRKVFRVVAVSSPAQRRRWLAQAEQIVNASFPK